jgi:hypothetical protein
MVSTLIEEPHKIEDKTNRQRKMEKNAHKDDNIYINR